MNKYLELPLFEGILFIFDELPSIWCPPIFLFYVESGIGCKAPWRCNPVDGSGSSTDLEDNRARHFPWVNQSPCSDRALYHLTSTNLLSLINKNLLHTPSCIHIYILIPTTKLIQSQNQVASVGYQSAKYGLPWRSYWNSPCTYLGGMQTLRRGQELLPPLSKPSALNSQEWPWSDVILVGRHGSD